MSDQSSDFSERLKAMREGRKASAPPQPSLKDRLQQHAQPARPQAAAPPTELKSKIQSNIQSKFQQKKLEPETASPGALQSGASSDENLPQFEMGKLPEKKQKKAQVTASWTPEDGGICPACQVYNPAHVAFCGECRAMLIRSEVVVEVITSYPITEIRGLVKTFVDKLAKLNVRTTEDMLRIGLNHKNRQMLMKHTGLSDRSLMRLIHQSDMCRIPSMNPEHTSLLELLGIFTLEDLLKHKPLELYNKIQQSKIKLNQNHIVFLPTKNAVAVWLEEGHELTPLKI